MAEIATPPMTTPPTTTLPHGLNWRPETRQWVVTTQRLADIVLRDPHIGTVLDPDRAPVPAATAAEVPTAAQFFDLWYRRGANHPALNRRLRTVYGASAVGGFGPVFDAMAAESARQMPGTGDLVAEFAAPFALHSTFRLMGFPAHLWPSLGTAHQVLMAVLRRRSRGAPGLSDRQLDMFRSVLRFLRVAVDEAVTAPEPSPLAAALAAHAAATPWADVAAVGQLLAAGVPQVETGIAVSAHALYTQEGLASRAAAGDVDPGAVAEEAMRLAPPFLGIFGWVVEHCDCLGVRLPPRSAVLVDVPAVNSDPEQVVDPESFCPARSRADNVTFGRGTHYCLGAAGARAQVTAALRGLLATRPGLVLGEPRRIDDGFAQSVKALPYR